MYAANLLNWSNFSTSTYLLCLWTELAYFTSKPTKGGWVDKWLSFQKNEWRALYWRVSFPPFFSSPLFFRFFFSALRHGIFKNEDPSAYDSDWATVQSRARKGSTWEKKNPHWRKISSSLLPQSRWFSRSVSGGYLTSFSFVCLS